VAKKKDENETAFSTLEELIRRDAERNGLPVQRVQPAEKDEKKVAAGRKGGKKGGTQRAKRLSSMKRKDSASRAAKARWSKRSHDS
jgi:hypothetical protein